MAITLLDYKTDLLKRLRNPDYAAGYLREVMLDFDQPTFSIALKDVIDAFGGVGKLAAKAKLPRQSIYKALSRDGNPSIATLQRILKPLGFQVDISRIKKAA